MGCAACQLNVRKQERKFSRMADVYLVHLERLSKSRGEVPLFKRKRGARRREARRGKEQRVADGANGEKIDDCDNNLSPTGSFT